MEKIQTFDEYIVSTDAICSTDTTEARREILKDAKMVADVASMYKNHGHTLKLLLDTLTLSYQKYIINNATPFEVIPYRNKLKAVDEMRAMILQLEAESDRRDENKAEPEGKDKEPSIETVIGGDNASSI